MSVVAITNRKGGTGKTTTAVNLAACLAEMGHSVLLVDADAQANATASLGAEVATRGAGTSALITDGSSVSDATVGCSVEGLDLVPAGPDLATAEMELGGGDEAAGTLRDKLAGDRHDFVIIDTPPSMGKLAALALVAAQDVIVPLQCDYLSLEGLREFAANLSRLRDGLNPGMRLAGLLKTMYDGRTRLARDVSDELDRHFGSKVFRTSIPRNVRLAEAPSYGVPVTAYDPGCPGAKAYRELAKECVERLQ